MPKVLIIHNAEPSTYRDAVDAWRKHAPVDFEIRTATPSAPEELEELIASDPPDAIVLAVPAWTIPVRELLRRHEWPTRLIVSWDCGMPAHLMLFQELYSETDGWLIHNHDYWDGIGRLPNTFPVLLGIDRQSLRVSQAPAERSAKALWVGSRAMNQANGYERLIAPLKGRLQKEGITLETFEADDDGFDPRSPEDRAAWYNQAMVLVCASEAEGSFAPALEAASCGCTIVSTTVGNLPQLIRPGANGYLVARSLDALSDSIVMACRNYPSLSAAMQQDIEAWDWRARSTEFYAAVRSILEPSQPQPRRDLRAQVTVFVTTIGAPTFDVCLQRLREQDCQFPLVVIDRVAPMSAAFQRMLDDCTTPFFVQVDEDMLLYANAIGTLYDRISEAPADVAMYCADLHDAHLRRNIQGVKIFRHAVARQYPFEPQDSFEVTQLMRMESGGWRYLVSPTDGGTPVPGRTLGLHGVQWTHALIYERYQTLLRRRFARGGKMLWLEKHALEFLQRYFENPNDQNFFAVLGTIAGALAARGGEAAAKDYRRYDEIPGFAALEEFLKQFPPAHED